jgi:sucrose phosphorylase
MKNEVQLIAYADRLGGTLGRLRELLEGPLAGLFGGLHLLPFFHRIDGADAGFDPIDHTAVDARLGSWTDVRALANRIDLMVDVIVNHISTASPQFQDFATRGRDSPFNGMFLTLESVFPHGAREEDLLRIYRPRPGLPFTSMTLGNGTRRILWTTFTPQQVDIDVGHPCGRAYLEDILGALAANGVRIVRFDAIGYAVKKSGGSCFMMPETFDFIADLSATAQRSGLQVLVEVHSNFRTQIEVAAHVDWVYDFALPPLLLHAFLAHSAKRLKQWARIRPRNCLTVLDTHDGIGVIDAGRDPSDEGGQGLLTDDELSTLVDWIHAASGETSRDATGSAARNLDLYQVNCTFYDALGGDETRYLLARAVQFFLPGIPQVYYVGLLAGSNDVELLARSGVGRDINRHFYSADEIAGCLRRPVVAKLLDLIRLRNSHPAFRGHFELLDTTDDSLGLQWRTGDSFARLHVNFVTGEHLLEYSCGTGVRHFPIEADKQAARTSR